MTPWDTANDAVLTGGCRVLIDDPARFDGVTAIGVDEHSWRHTRKSDKYVTVIIDLTDIRDGTGPARLLDMVEGRSKQACKSWLGDEALANLEVIVGYDDDLAKEVTRVTNRIHGLLTQIHPALERALGSDLHHRAVLELLARFGGPTGLAKTQRRQLIAATKPRAPRKHLQLVDAVQAALAQQTVVVPGTAAAELVLPHLARQLTGLLDQRDAIETQIEEMFFAHLLPRS